MGPTWASERGERAGRGQANAVLLLRSRPVPGSWLGGAQRVTLAEKGDESLTIIQQVWRPPRPLDISSGPQNLRALHSVQHSPGRDLPTESVVPSVCHVFWTRAL